MYGCLNCSARFDQAGARSKFRFQDLTSCSPGDAIFYSVIGGPDAISPFIAAGNRRDTLTGNTLSYLTGMFIPDSDLIFANNID